MGMGRESSWKELDEGGAPSAIGQEVSAAVYCAVLAICLFSSLHLSCLQWRWTPFFYFLLFFFLVDWLHATSCLLPIALLLFSSLRSTTPPTLSRTGTPAPAPLHSIIAQKILNCSRVCLDLCKHPRPHAWHSTIPARLSLCG